MYSSNQSMNISLIKESLLSSLDDKLEIIHILKNLTYSDGVELFWYDDKKKCLFDKINKTKINIKFLQSNDKSMMGEAYNKKKRIVVTIYDMIAIIMLP